MINKRDLVIPIPLEDIGEVSDGYHTFNELYAHRHALFITLMFSYPDLAWRSLKHHDGTMFDGWFIAGLDLPTGQITYHLPISLWDTLEGIKVLNRAPKWDGHTSEDVLNRLYDWVDVLKQILREGSDE